MALIYNATFDSGTRVLSLLDKAGNVISSCEVPSKSNELTLTATADNSSVKLTKNGTLSNTYEVNTGSGWTAYEFETVIPLNAGQSCKWRCSAHPTTQSLSNHVRFVMTGTIEASGNCNSMLSSDFENLTSLSGYDYAFFNLFNRCTSLTKAPELPSTILATSCYHNMFAYCSSLTRTTELPAMTLAPDCYNSLFFGCSSLTQVHELPATNLEPAPRCYSYMFAECTALTRAPELPATTLSVACYTTMFRKCTSLIQPPELPASTIDKSCYSSMFKDCSALTQAPSLPATNLVTYCYAYMFDGCTSLTKAPELPATTLEPSCYKYMFKGCNSLNEVHCHMPSSYSSSDVTSYASDWLLNVASTGTFYTNADANWSSGASGIPEGWTRVPAVDDITKPLTFRATQDGSTVKLYSAGSPSGSFQTSRDGGNTWTDYTIGTDITINTGEEVSFRAKANRTSANGDDYFRFNMTGKIEAWHNVMSLYRTNDFATYKSVVVFAFTFMFHGCTSLTKAPVLPATTLAEYCYHSMFSQCTSLTKAPALPATTLAEHCYYNMFSDCTSLAEAPVLQATTTKTACYQLMFDGCTSLTKAPALPATTLADSCYHSMFRGCTSLTKVPALPATTLAGSCYQYMFKGCTSLVEAPELPATTLADGCYGSMFSDCTSLTEAPALPATTLDGSCYYCMFFGCTSLTKAPELPATTLANSCYNCMFQGCQSLKEVRISATTTATGALNQWLYNVSATGDFYCDPNATIFPTDSESGIPSNWTRHALADYPQT